MEGLLCFLIVFWVLRVDDEAGLLAMGGIECHHVYHFHYIQMGLLQCCQYSCLHIQIDPHNYKINTSHRQFLYCPHCKLY